MSQQNDIKALQDDARVVAEAQVGRDYTDKLLKWIIGLMLSAIIAGGGLYGKWITDSIHEDEKSISKIVQRESLRDENLDILNSKIDIILSHSGLIYNGPEYKHLELPESQH